MRELQKGDLKNSKGSKINRTCITPKTFLHYHWHVTQVVIKDQKFQIPRKQWNFYDDEIDEFFIILYLKEVFIPELNIFLINSQVINIYSIGNY